MVEKDNDSDPFQDGEPSLSQHLSNEFGETMDISGETTANSETPSRANPRAWVGRRLGKYQITELLGVGGMGVVLKGHDVSIERDVAIKVLPGELSANKQSLDRFLEEARSAGKLNHPNTVTIFEIAQEGEDHFLVMEVVSGGSADDHIYKSGAYSTSEATRIVIESCRGLAAAHKSGLVHRDVKPANLLLTEDGTVKVSDFGLAKRTQSESLQLTQEGQVLGTPYYMSPEQWESGDVDARSDIYSLGATYYGLLTGKSPFQESGSVAQVMYAHCHASRPDPSEVNPRVPEACGQIIMKAMATKPEERYQSMEEMEKDLNSLYAALSGVGITLPSQSGSFTKPPSPSTNSASSGSNSHRNLLVPGAIVLLLLGLASVGGYLWLRNGSDAGSGLGSSAAAALGTGGQPDPSLVAIAAPTGEPIKVGILHSLTGTMSDSESPVVDAALLAIEQLNRDGGLLGRPVEAVVADGRSDSETFASEAERLIVEENVCTVFGCWTSASRKTVVPVFEEFDHLLVYPVQYEGVEESPNVIYTGATPNQQIIPAVKWAYAFEGKRKFFLIGSDYVFPRMAHEIIKDQLNELGAEIVGEQFLALGSRDVQAAVDQIIETKPDVILNLINGDSNQAFFSALRKGGITPAAVPTISFSIDEEELRHLDTETMAGDYAAWTYFQSIDSPENAEFISKFHKKFGPQRLVTDPMEATYFGIQLWAAAVRDAGTTETKDIRRSMRNQRMLAPEGNVRIDPTTQHTFKTPRIGQVTKEGQFKIVWTATSPEKPIPYPATRTAEEWRAILHDLYAGWGDHWEAPPEK
ncbi:transporter substrate-binding protein [Roseimaritima multifibrata]|nr:transporter substrate-binding protein [Roseimaritima multifibrata]